MERTTDLHSADANPLEIEVDGVGYRYQPPTTGQMLALHSMADGFAADMAFVQGCLVGCDAYAIPFHHFQILLHSLSVYLEPVVQPDTPSTFEEGMAAAKEQNPRFMSADEHQRAMHAEFAEAT